MRRFVIAVVSVVAITAASARSARADTPFGGAHVAYAPGLATGGDDEGFRHQLDAGVLFALGNNRVGSRDGMWSHGSATLLGPAILTGFAASPTYALVEIGRGEDTTLLGWGWFVGPAVRVEAEHPAAGATARAAVDLFALQLGLRAVAIAGPKPAEIDVALTIGLGRF